MATVLISTIKNNVSNIKTANKPTADIYPISNRTIVKDLSYNTGSIDLCNYPEFSIASSERLSVVSEVLPFRVRFTNLIVPRVSFADVPVIGLQVIGLNNYIL